MFMMNIKPIKLFLRLFTALILLINICSNVAYDGKFVLLRKAPIPLKHYTGAIISN